MKYDREVTPARLQALLWLAALGGLFAQLAPGSQWEFSDEDSVPQLTAARACELARPHLAAASCADFTSTAQWASVRVRTSTTEKTVCFLKARRWFVADVGFDITCLETPPVLGRVASLKAEQDVERAWATTAVSTRARRLRERFVANLDTALAAHRATAAPSRCEGLPAQGQVPSVDVDLLRAKKGAPPWTTLSSGTLARGSAEELGFRLQGLKERGGRLVVVVDALEKALPRSNTPGRLEASVVVVDWLEGKALCEAPVAVEELSGDERRFKDAVLAELSNTVRLLGGGALELVR